MVAQLDLIHFNLAPSGDTDVFLQNAHRPLSVGQVMVKVNGVVVYFLEGLGLVRDLKTLAKLRHMEDIVDFGHFLW
jgi:hypothetical protein